LGCALGALGEYRRWLALLDEAEALARALADRARLGRVLPKIACRLRITGDWEGAIAAGRQALELAAEIGDCALQGEAPFTLGLAYSAIGDFGRAAELLRWSVEVADGEPGTPSTDVRIQSRAHLAVTLGALGAFVEGRRHGEEALRLATLEGRGSALITAHGCLGLLYLAQGDLEHAIRVWSRAWPSVVPPTTGSGCQGSRRAWALPLRSRDAWAEGRGVAGGGAISESVRTGARNAYWVTRLSEVCRLAGHR